MKLTAQKRNNNRQWLFILSMITLSIFASSQNKNDMATQLSFDYGFGKTYNNYAAALTLKYNVFDALRLAPSFSVFANKKQMKMRALSLDFHYLFTDLNANFFKKLKKYSLTYYPIFGFNIVNATRTDHLINKRSNYSYSFGFNAGAGIEMPPPPKIRKEFKDFRISLELQYIAVDEIYRPLFRLGLSYYFKNS